MKIYVSLPVLHRRRAIEIARTLEHGFGHTIVSSWHEAPNAGYNGDWKRLRDCAIRDLLELDQADVLVQELHQPSWGASTELGYAIAQKKRIILIGDEPLGVFHSLFPVVPSLEAVGALL